MIKAAIRLRNGGVMVFDGSGEEMPVYQGQYEEVKDAVLREATVDADFFHWFDCAARPEKVARSRW